MSPSPYGVSPSLCSGEVLGGEAPAGNQPLDFSTLDLRRGSAYTAAKARLKFLPASATARRPSSSAFAIVKKPWIMPS